MLRLPAATARRHQDTLQGMVGGTPEGWADWILETTASRSTAMMTRRALTQKRSDQLRGSQNKRLSDTYGVSGNLLTLVCLVELVWTRDCLSS